MKAKVVLAALLMSSMVYSQIQRKEVHKIESYEPILKTEKSKVKMEVFENNRIESSKTYDLNTIKIPENRNVNIAYDDKIKNVEQDLVPAELVSQFSTNEFKVIPEILVSKVKGKNEMVSYQIYFTSSQPFKYDHNTQKFNGQLEFVLVDPINQNTVSDLEDPVYVEVKSSEVDDISPNSFEINHLSIPSSQIKLSQQNGMDSLQIKIVTKSKLEGYPAYVPIEPSLKITAQDTKIMGYGLEATQLQV